jgi:hypothetical protein
VDIGREVLSQLTTPVSKNFSDTIYHAHGIDAERVSSIGGVYVKTKY